MNKPTRVLVDVEYLLALENLLKSLREHSQPEEGTVNLIQPASVAIAFKRAEDARRKSERIIL